MKVNALNVDVLKDRKRFEALMDQTIQRAHSDEYREALILLKALYPPFVKWVNQGSLRNEKDMEVMMHGFTTALSNLLTTLALSVSPRPKQLGELVLEELTEKCNITLEKLDE